jgi:hypothetical protein
MIPVQVNNQFHNKVISPPVRGDRKSKRATMSRRAWAVVTLLAAGFFIHDAVCMPCWSCAE